MRKLHFIYVVCYLVIVTFLVLYLTKKLRIAEEKQAQELHRNTLNDRLLHEVAEQMQTLQHQPRNHSQYILFQFVFPTGLGTEIKQHVIIHDYDNIPSSYFI